MPTKMLQKIEKFEVQSYQKPSDLKSLPKTHVSFTGSPRKHPYDTERVIIFTDPLSTNAFYIEFNKKDISYLEELPSIVKPEGEAMKLIRIWVKKSSIAIRCIPFVVEDTTNIDSTW